MTTLDDLRAANERYAATHPRRPLPAEPARRVVVLTCMDARLDPARFLGLAPGDAHVLRNAGGVVTDDVLRSLAISHHLLGTEEVLVIGHTRCGMTTFANEDLRERVGNAAGDADFMPFADVAARVRESVRAVVESPLVPESFRASGFVFDVATGRLDAV
jgi:carbonic anhydrase